MVIRRIVGKSSIFDCVSVSSYYNSGSNSTLVFVMVRVCSVGVMYSYISCNNSDYIVG